MMLWPILALMTLGAAFAVCWPLVRRQEPARLGNDVAVYRDQLEEINRDESANLIGRAEADAARVEVSRRLIAAADNAKAETLSPTSSVSRYRRATLATAVVLLPIAAASLYLALGSPKLAPISMMSAEAGQQALPEGIEQTVAEVEAYLEKNPGNGRGWELLAPVYIRLGRFDDAVNARRKALQIFGPDAARLGDLGEAIYMASGGVVTPEAKELFLRAEAADAQDVMAQYYLGVAAKQEGRRDEAEKRWRALIASAPEGAEYLPLIKRALAQIDQKGPQVSAGAAPDHDGNSIEMMVERLAERLKTDGSDTSGWIQLVRSYRVLGKPDKATAAIADARAALSKKPEALHDFDDGLKSLGPGNVEASTGPALAAASAPQPGPNSADMAAAATMTPDQRNGMIDSMVQRLAERLKANGSDVEGWIRLVRSYRVLGNAEKATAAIADAHAALANDPERLRVLDEGLNSLGAQAGPGEGGGSAGSAVVTTKADQPGPNAADMAAAAKMTPSDRNAMIEGMVARLAQRMAENGSDVEGWLRLIRAYSVLGERDKALAAAANARTALAGDVNNLRRIGELTKELGLEGL
jgi:cytochrome c-type biogenesis protein CcmH